MKKIIISIIVIALLVIAPGSFATTYYVSELFGDDNNDGLSEATPFATIQKAADVMVAGDMVIIDFGEYHETIAPKNNGTADNPIVYKAKEQGEAEISFGETTLLPIFTLHSGSIYVMDNVFRTINVLTEDGVPLTKKDSLAALDVEPGWYHHRATAKLYIRSTDDADPAVHADTVFFSEYAFDIVEGSYITIDGFKLRNCIHAIVADNLVHLPGLIIQNNEFAYEDKDLSSNAITIDGGGVDSVNTYENFVISNNIFINGATLRIKHAGRNSIISDNSFLGDPAIGEAGSDILQIEGDDAFPGVQCDGLVIERNFFSYINKRCMYIRYGSLDDITIQNNIFYSGYFNCIDVKNATNVNILNNTFVFQGASHPVRLREGTDGRIYNNICAYTSRGYFWFFDNAADPQMLWELDYNYYVNDTSLVSDRDDQMIRSKLPPVNSSDCLGGPHAVYGHRMKTEIDTVIDVFGNTLYLTEVPDMKAPAYPLFADTATGIPEGLRLVEGSNAIDVGFADVTPAVDFFGNPRDDKPDIGAIEFGVTGVAKTLRDFFLQNYQLSQNYPNPFNPETKIELKLPKSGKIKLVIYNILGQKVATLFDGFKRAGTYSVKWNGLDMYGNAVPSGIYFYHLAAGSITRTAKMTLLR